MINADMLLLEAAEEAARRSLEAAWEQGWHDAEVAVDSLAVNFENDIDEARRTGTAKDRKDFKAAAQRYRDALKGIRAAFPGYRQTFVKYDDADRCAVAKLFSDHATALAAVTAERDRARRELAAVQASGAAEHAGVMAMRSKHGAMPHETFPAFVARLAMERGEAVRARYATIKSLHVELAQEKERARGYLNRVEELEGVDGGLAMSRHENEKLRAEVARLTAQRDEWKAYVDDIAAALHPHWGDKAGNGYLPGQLADRARGYEAEVARLTARVAELETPYETIREATFREGAEACAEAAGRLDVERSRWLAEGQNLQEFPRHQMVRLHQVVEACRTIAARGPSPAVEEAHDPEHPHLIGGEFQSDKYPTCPRGKVPLSVKDTAAQDLLWTYAQRRRDVDTAFAADLETALLAKGYEPTPAPAPAATASRLCDHCGKREGYASRPGGWVCQDCYDAPSDPAAQERIRKSNAECHAKRAKPPAVEDAPDGWTSQPGDPPCARPGCRHEATSHDPRLAEDGDRRPWCVDCPIPAQTADVLESDPPSTCPRYRGPPGVVRRGIRDTTGKRRNTVACCPAGAEITRKEAFMTALTAGEEVTVRKSASNDWTHNVLAVRKLLATLDAERQRHAETLADLERWETAALGVLAHRKKGQVPAAPYFVRVPGCVCQCDACKAAYHTNARCPIGCKRVEDAPDGWVSQPGDPPCARPGCGHDADEHNPIPGYDDDENWMCAACDCPRYQGPPVAVRRGAAPSRNYEQSGATESVPLSDARLAEIRADAADGRHSNFGLIRELLATLDAERQRHAETQFNLERWETAASGVLASRKKTQSIDPIRADHEELRRQRDAAARERDEQRVAKADREIRR